MTEHPAGAIGALPTMIGRPQVELSGMWDDEHLWQVMASLRDPEGLEEREVVINAVVTIKPRKPLDLEALTERMQS